MTPPLLGSRVAIQCARRAHNDFDPTQSDLEKVDVPTTRWSEGGIAFEESVATHLLAGLGSRCLDVRHLPHSQALPQTVAALNERVPLILGGALPPDTSGQRRGRPDLLVAHADGYLPADIKWHQVTKESTRGSAQTTPLSQLGDLAPIGIMPGLAPATSHRFTDLMQLAHYWRMLEALAAAPDIAPLGGLIGSDSFADPDPFLLWQPLDAPVFTTFSRSRGTAKRSALERYDHEFEFRRKVVAIAQQQGEPDAPAPLVRPIIVEECDCCPWHDVCLEDVGEIEPSVHITSGRLGLREWNALRAAGIRTVNDLADLELDDQRLDGYWGEIDVTESRARSRLSDAVTRAQMSLGGEVLRRLPGVVDPIPRADVEVDFDLEWDSDGRIYLWGLLITRDGRSKEESIFAWEPLDDDSESELAAAAIERLRQLQSEAEAQGESFAVYHYSHPEITMVRSLIRRGVGDLPDEAWWNAFTTDHFIDLLTYVKQRFIGLRGLGLKTVAQEAGFSWDDATPSGEESMEWIEEARSADEVVREAAQRRLLRYNADDVGATLAVREWLESAERWSACAPGNGTQPI